MKTPKTLYQYYRDRDFSPTHANFKTEEELGKYQEHRYDLFLNKLKLPPLMFRNTRLVEFGPDTGENSLVFARWGAKLTLVEPHETAWNYINRYFDIFGLKPQLTALLKSQLEQFTSNKSFNFIDVEGFIHTLRPMETWMHQFSRLLEDNGIAIISYYETHGSILELFQKLLFTQAQNIGPDKGVGMAWKLFQTKWNSIPHTRSFDSWVKDVLENPFTRHRYFLNASHLYKAINTLGFSLYSSWPNYSDNMDIYWHKTQLEESEILQNNLKYISRSCLSFTFGKKLFLCTNSFDKVRQINNILDELLIAIDRMIEGFTNELLHAFKKCIHQINSVLQNEDILSNSKRAKTESIQLLESMVQMVDALKRKDLSRLVSICNSDEIFIKSWGIPCHFAVFRKNNHLPQPE